MKLSRVAVIASTVVLSLIGSSVAVLNWSEVSAAERSSAPVPYTFTMVAETPQMSISVSKESMFALIDKDEDLNVGGVFQIKLTTKEGPKTLINAVVAICGYNGLLLMKGKTFNGAGVLESETSEPMPFANVSPSSTSGIIYKHLCENSPRPTKSDPRYKAPERYNKFWT